jgi:serine phosphatase RsbU (regulator of sigma subunit)
MDLYLQIFFTTLAISFGILHFFIYLYNKRCTSNIFFSLFLFLYALNVFFDYQVGLVTSWEEELFYLRLHRAVMPYNAIFALLFVYYAFDLKVPKHFWVIVAAIVVTGFFSVFEPIKHFNYVLYAQVLVLIETIRIFIKAIRIKKQDAWILTTGFMLLFLFSMYDFFMDLEFIQPVAEIYNGYPFGFLLLIITASIYLARDFARANKTILEKEREAKEMEISQKLLEAEDNRKARELDEARKLQLSLLPQCDTNILDYEFCFDMRTASEVGGDYYDYNVSENDEISVVIGDATDHGMKAGMMVSIIKSLFLTHVNSAGINDFLNNCSHTIKQMKLKNLYMALMLLKIKDYTITFSSAGIPPLLIFRKNVNEIEEHKIKGMPLGAVDTFPYEIKNVSLNKGDVVLLMTDGLPELFNSDKNMFGYERIKDIFIQNSDKPVNEIANNLFLAADEWLDGSNQNDDMTIVAFRLT